jgi:hypothetical protein
MRSTLLASLAVATLLGVGCASRPAYRADAPVTTPEGVTVALVGQKCDRRSRQDTNDILDLVVDARVTNNSPDPVTVDPKHLRLIVAGDATSPDRPPEPFTLAPGAASDINVHYHRWGSINARCNTRMSLYFDGAAPPISFIPAHKDT